MEEKLTEGLLFTGMDITKVLQDVIIKVLQNQKKKMVRKHHKSI